MTTTISPPHPDARVTAKETLISIIIAFALAFVFRGFVVEAFVIPTGSMAPTLLGQHMRITDPRNGYSWSVGPWDMIRDSQDAQPLQGTSNRPIKVTDPLTGETLDPMINVPAKKGDRIFVMKYLASVYEPSRFDCVVFKNPTDTSQNYIKRLLGLPGEQLALIDGDVWTRKPQPGDGAALGADEDNLWLLPGWTIARKPELPQRSMWQLMFDSRYTPLPQPGARPFKSPWLPSGDATWDLSKGTEYTCQPKTEAALEWDVVKRPIVDRNPYNEGTLQAGKDGRFPVGDLRVAAAVRPGGPNLKAGLLVRAHRHEFRAVLAPDGTGYRASLEMRPDTAGRGGEDGWKVLASAPSPKPLESGRVANLDFWHTDQTLSLYIDDKLVLRAEYNWSPDERLRNCLDQGESWREIVRNTPTALAEPSRYRSTAAGMRFSGAPFSLYRVALSRDIHYQSDVFMAGNNNRFHPKKDTPAAATGPRSTLNLSPDQYFTCGDNSAASLDGRLWDDPEPWVATEIDRTPNVVHRHLLIGKAFFVYFPAPTWTKGIPIPDFGRMRFIW